MGRMTKDEYATRDYLADKLAQQGYVTYAELFSLFDLHMTDNPGVVGYMIPEKATIVLNETVNEHDLCIVIRHEIMHEYLSHHMRLMDHVARKLGLDPDDLDDMSLREVQNEIYGKVFQSGKFPGATPANIAGDFEISNLAYTEQDKKDIQKLRLNGEIVGGLVTEMHHPDWVNLSVEEMYDLLEQERQEAESNIQQEMNDFLDDLLNDPDLPQDIKDMVQKTKDMVDRMQNGDMPSQEEVEGLMNDINQLSDKYGDDPGNSKENNAIDQAKDKAEQIEDQVDSQPGQQGQPGQNGQEGQQGDGPSMPGQSGQEGQDGQGGKPGKGSKSSQKGKSGKGDNGQGQDGGQKGDKKSNSSDGQKGKGTPQGGGDDSSPFNRDKGGSDKGDGNGYEGVIHGTFKHGKFYDRDGNEIIPGR